MGSNKITSREEAERLIAEYEKSSLSRQKFCEKNNIKLGTFHWWMKRHKDTKGIKTDTKPSFVPFTRQNSSRSDSSNTSSDLIIDFPSGTRLKWHGKELHSSLPQLISLLHGIVSI